MKTVDEKSTTKKKTIEPFDEYQNNTHTHTDIALNSNEKKNKNKKTQRFKRNRSGRSGAPVVRCRCQENSSTHREADGALFATHGNSLGKCDWCKKQTSNSKVLQVRLIKKKQPSQTTTSTTRASGCLSTSHRPLHITCISRGPDNATETVPSRRANIYLFIGYLSVACQDRTRKIGMELKCSYFECWK